MQYGIEKYGLQKYAADNENGGTESDYWVDLARYAPPFLARIRELHDIYWTEGFEVGRFVYDVHDAFAQTRINSATWGLVRWEQIFGIETNLQLSYEQRREILLTKLRSHGTATPKFLADGVEMLCGGEVKIIEHTKEYRFVVRFVGIKGIPRNLASIMQFLDTVKPAHLAYGFEYRYTTWEDMQKTTWGAVRAKSWEDLRTMMEV